MESDLVIFKVSFTAASHFVSVENVKMHYVSTWFSKNYHIGMLRWECIFYSYKDLNLFKMKTSLLALVVFLGS